MEFFHEIELSQSAVEAIARGLYAVARADGEVHLREASLVASFWAETGGGADALSELERRETIAAGELAASLHSADERQLFVKTALLLAWADGKVTDAERKTIDGFAGALGVDAATLGGLEEGVKEFLLGQIAPRASAESVAQVARELKV
jgi:tellurite resistance protein